MPEVDLRKLVESTLKDIISLYENFSFYEAEALVSQKITVAAKRIHKRALEYVVRQRSMRRTVNAIGAQNGYHRSELTPKTITLKGGIAIRIPSYYALSVKEKMGPKRTGANGRGKHLLLNQWGFLDTWSPGHWEEVARAGLGSVSYDAAERQLKSQGMSMSGTKIAHVIREVAAAALKDGPATGMALALRDTDTFAGKRICITIDGGRIQQRIWKKGMAPKKGGRGFYTSWIEPKLLCIYELDQYGEKAKGSDPLYYATLAGQEQLYSVLTALAEQLHLAEALEIACIADGAPWIYARFTQLAQELKIQEKTTIIADYYHGVEHLAKIVDVDTGKSDKERHEQIDLWAGYLKEGKIDLLAQLVTREAKRTNRPKMLEEFHYFEERKERMRYDQYLAKHLPIGSGSVESAVKQVINQRIKAAGSFWLKDNAEHFLFLRCIFMSNRWQPFVGNLIVKIRLPYNSEG